MGTKTCTRCVEELPVSDFNKDKSRKDGLQPWCRGCMKAYRAANAEVLKAKQKAYAEAHAEEIAGRRRAYREANQDAIKQRWQDYYWSNRGELLQKDAEYYQANREDRLEYQRRWAEDNPDLVRAQVQRRRAREAEVTLEPVDLELVWVNSNGICCLCGTAMDRQYQYPDPRFPSLEHLTPLRLGGSHAYDNLTYTHLKCNLTKSGKLLEDMVLPLNPPLVSSAI